MTNIFEKIPYKDQRVRIVWQPKHSTLWLNLTDLCDILKRKILITNKKALDLCPGRTQFSATEKGKLHWYIPVYEVRNLTSFVSKDNKQIAKECTQLENWAARQEKEFLSKQSQGTQEKPSHKQTFDKEKKTIDFRQITDRLYANATQMGQYFNKLPSEWLRLVEVQKLREDLIANGTFARPDDQVKTSRGATGGTWMEITLAEKFAQWLSPEFAIWYKQQTLSSGRPEKNRAYTKPPLTPPTSNKPTTIEQCWKQIEELEKQAATHAHKVEFYDNFVENKQWFTSTRIALELDTTATQLHRFLVEQKVCVYENKQYRAVSKGLQDEVPYSAKGKNGKFYAGPKSYKWTHAGREYIIDLWSKHHS